LGLREPSQALGARSEPFFPVDVPVDPRSGDLGDLRLLPEEGGELGKELVENQGVL